MFKFKRMIFIATVISLMLICLSACGSLNGQRFYYYDSQGVKDSTNYVEFSDDQFRWYRNGGLYDYADYRMIDNGTIELKGTMNTFIVNYDKAAGTIDWRGEMFKK